MVVSVESELLLALDDADYAARILTVAVRNSRSLTIEQCVLGSMPYNRYLNTAHWQTVAVECKRSAGNRCQLCNRAGGLQAHHRTYERRGFEQPGDLIALCAECHKLFHDARQIAEPAAPEPSASAWPPPLPDVDWKDDTAARGALAGIVKRKLQEMNLRST